MSNPDNSRLLKTIRKEPVDRTPVWIMRQAGRYLPEYRAVRAEAGDFLSLCKNPELACEVTLQPLRRFSLDAAILFSDILTIPDAMGLELYFAEGEGPGFNRPIRSLEDIDRLPTASVVDDLRYVMDAASLIRRSMPSELPLIGFSGSPWTLATYMLEGGSSREFKKPLQWLYNEPEALHRLLTKLSTVVTAYLAAQIQAGVNLVMLFDSWGGILSPGNYQNFSLRYMQQIIQQVQKLYPQIPIILFTKGGGQSLEAQAASGCQVLSLDWTTDLGLARARVGENVALQGNLDPAVLRSRPDIIQEQVKQVLDAYGQGSGHIFNLGHGITPDVPPENVAAMIEAIQAFSPAYQNLC